MPVFEFEQKEVTTHTIVVRAASKREAEEYLVALRPKPVFKPSLRKRPSRPVETQPNSNSPHPASLSDEPPSPRGRGKDSRTILQPAQPDVFNFRFAADRSFKDKFECLAEVLGVTNAHPSVKDVVVKVIDTVNQRDGVGDIETGDRQSDSIDQRFNSRRSQNHQG